MVANAPRLALAVFKPVDNLPRPIYLRTIAAPPPALRTVKLLDLLTNRYHLALLNSHDDASLTLDLPRPAPFHPGQRIRFIIADAQTLVSRQSMQTALITEVTSQGTGLRLHLCPLAEAVAA